MRNPPAIADAITMPTRRDIVVGMAAAMAASAIAGALPAWAAAPGKKIGIIGSGRIGGTLGEFWAKAGYQVMFSDTNPDTVKALVDRVPGSKSGTAQEAAAFGDAVLISVPYGALPGIGRDLGPTLKGKIVMDTGNPNPNRDGDMAVAAKAKGTGIASAEYLPGVRLVRVFNSVPFMLLRSEAHRAGDKVGVPIAADDKDALQFAVQLVRDTGFEPVVVGGLARAKEFDSGTIVYGQALTAADIKQKLGL